MWAVPKVNRPQKFHGHHPFRDHSPSLVRAVIRRLLLRSDRLKRLNLRSDRFLAVVIRNLVRFRKTALHHNPQFTLA